MYKKAKSFIVAAAMAVAFTVSASEVVIGTGTKGGGYHSDGVKVAQQIKAVSKSKITSKVVVDTGGAFENIDGFNEEDYDIIMVQPDVLMYNKPTRPFKAKKASTEYIFWLHGEDSPFTSLEDIEGNKDYKIVLVGGAEATMKSFQHEDAGYKENVFLHENDLEDAFEFLAEGVDDDDNKVGGVLYVGARIPAGVAKDYSDVVFVGQAEDGDFNDAEDINGDPLYVNCSIPKDRLSGMHSESWGEPDTICMNSMIVYAKDIEGFKKVRKAVRKAVKNMK